MLRSGSPSPLGPRSFFPFFFPDLLRESGGSLGEFFARPPLLETPKVPLALSPPIIRAPFHCPLPPLSCYGLHQRSESTQLSPVSAGFPRIPFAPPFYMLWCRRMFFEGPPVPTFFLNPAALPLRPIIILPQFFLKVL